MQMRLTRSSMAERRLQMVQLMARELLQRPWSALQPLTAGLLEAAHCISGNM